MSSTKTPTMVTSMSQSQVSRPAISASSASVSTTRSNALIANCTLDQWGRAVDQSFIGGIRFLSPEKSSSISAFLGPIRVPDG